MRILHIGKYFPPASGGMERFLGDIVTAQRAAGDETSVLVHSDPNPDPAGDPPWLMRCPVWMSLFFAPISPAFPLWLRRAIRRGKPDVLHVHMPNASAFWLLLLPFARRRPLIIHWHSDVEPSRFKLSLRLAYPHYRIFEHALLERAEAIVVTSPHYLETSKPLREWRHKCHVIPLGVDPARLPEVPEGADGGWKPGGVRLLSVGRLTYYKGFETLVRAALLEPDWQLVIVGEGEDRPKLQRLLDAAGSPDRIRLLGNADDAEVQRLMATCDIYCLPSRERTEAFGIVLLEAMRYRRPLAVSDLPGSGVTWVARAGENAVLIDPEDVRAWREEVNRLAADPERRERYGRAGYERYVRDFDVHDTARRLRTLYAIALKVEAEDALAQQLTSVDPLDDLTTTTSTRLRVPKAAISNRILVVIPALNEAACIGEVIEHALALGKVDVVVVDDGSSDDTMKIALRSGATVLRAPLWQGAWGAIQTGIRYGVRNGYSSVVTMDADGQHEPAYLPALVRAARDADVVIAACPRRGSRARHIAWTYFRMLTGLRFEDLTSGFRYYNARACQLLAAEEATLLDYQDIGVLLLLRSAKLRIAEVPVAMNPRRSGASRIFSSWPTVARYMIETSLLCLARWNPPRAPRRARKGSA